MEKYHESSCEALRLEEPVRYMNVLVVKFRHVVVVAYVVPNKDLLDREDFERRSLNGIRWIVWRHFWNCGESELFPQGSRISSSKHELDS